MSAEPLIRVLVADDHAVVRAGLVLLLDIQPDLAVIGEAADGMDAVMRTRDLNPDVVLMDIRMPLLDGIEATRRITTESSARVVVLTTYDLDEYVYAALRAGACGFLLKHAPHEEMLLGVRAAARGDALLSPTVTSRLITEFTSRRPSTAAPPPELNRLTSRERNVFELMIRGKSNREIARTLSVTETTVKTHVTHTLNKLGLRDRVHAVVYGYETGLVIPGAP